MKIPTESSSIALNPNNFSFLNIGIYFVVSKCSNHRHVECLQSQCVERLYGVMSLSSVVHFQSITKKKIESSWNRKVEKS